MPAVEPPETEEGLFVSHLMLSLPYSQRQQISDGELTEAAETFFNNNDIFNQNDRTELVRITSGKTDFMTILFAETIDELEAFETELLSSDFGARLKRIDTFLSVTELSMYQPLEERVKDTLEAKGIKPDDKEYDDAYREQVERMETYQQRRLNPDLPKMRYVTFYPMTKRRLPGQNWYQLPSEERADMMSSHGEIGRNYSDSIQQIITSCVGLDDWEWGVTLYSEDPKQFKQLIYEMRFDEVSALYSDFGPFYTGLRIDPNNPGNYIPD